MNAVGHCPPNFECDTCDRYFGSEHAVNQHITAVEHWAESSEFSESEEPDFECDDCGDVFYDEDDLRDHKAKEHFYSEAVTPRGLSPRSCSPGRALLTTRPPRGHGTALLKLTSAIFAIVSLINSYP